MVPFLDASNYPFGKAADSRRMRPTRSALSHASSMFAGRNDGLVRIDSSRNQGYFPTLLDLPSETQKEESLPPFYLMQGR
jgi:hypothetical protein